MTKICLSHTFRRAYVIDYSVNRKASISGPPSIRLVKMSGSNYSAIRSIIFCIRRDAPLWFSMFSVPFSSPFILCQRRALSSPLILYQRRASPSSSLSCPVACCYVESPHSRDVPFRPPPGAPRSRGDSAEFESRQHTRSRSGVHRSRPRVQRSRSPRGPPASENPRSRVHRSRSRVHRSRSPRGPPASENPRSRDHRSRSPHGRTGTGAASDNPRSRVLRSRSPVGRTGTAQSGAHDPPREWLSHRRDIRDPLDDADRSPRDRPMLVKAICGTIENLLERLEKCGTHDYRLQRRRRGSLQTCFSLDYLHLFYLCHFFFKDMQCSCALWCLHVAHTPCH